MSIFKKKKKEEKILAEDASTFQKLWHDKRTHAAMVLGMYFVGIMILVIFMNVASKNNTFDYKPGEKANDYEKMKDSIKNSSFSFDYQITIVASNLEEEEVDTYKVAYIGDYTKDLETGYKEENNIITKYKIEKGIVYDTLNEDNPIIEDFYINIKERYLDLNYIFTMIKIKDYTEETEDGLNKYVYETIESADTKIGVSIYTDNKSIKRIQITETETIDNIVMDSTYILNYSLK